MTVTEKRVGGGGGKCERVKPGRESQRGEVRIGKQLTRGLCLLRTLHSTGIFYGFMRGGGGGVAGFNSS